MKITRKTVFVIIATTLLGIIDYVKEYYVL